MDFDEKNTFASYTYIKILTVLELWRRKVKADGFNAGCAPRSAWIGKMVTAGTRSIERAHTSALTEAAHLSLLEHYSAKQSADCRYPFKWACAHERFNEGCAPESAWTLLR